MVVTCCGGIAFYSLMIRSQVFRNLCIWAVRFKSSSHVPSYTHTHTRETGRLEEAVIVYFSSSTSKPKRKWL